MKLLIITTLLLTTFAVAEDKQPLAKPTESTLSPTEVAQLDALEKSLNKEVDARQRAESAYQVAYIKAQQASIQLEQQVRILERLKCGGKEALTKSDSGWKCMKIEVTSPPPAPTPSQ